MRWIRHTGVRFLKSRAFGLLVVPSKALAPGTIPYIPLFSSSLGPSTGHTAVCVQETIQISEIGAAGTDDPAADMPDRYTRNSFACREKMHAAGLTQSEIEVPIPSRLGMSGVQCHGLHD